jgi:hypothetical protein
VPVQHFLQRYRFIALFVLLLSYFAVMPVLIELEGINTRVTHAVNASLLLVVLAIVLLSIDRYLTWRLVTVGLTLATFVLWVVTPQDSPVPLQIARQGAVGIFLAHGVLRILRHLFLASHITVDLLAASLCVYLMLGVLWAVGYSMATTANSHAFTVPEGQDPATMRLDLDHPGEVLYFSFVTLTSLGYGDIVPKMPLARSLAALEALVGQLYLTVLVARLVSLHIMDSERAREDTGG